MFLVRSSLSKVMYITYIGISELKLCRIAPFMCGFYCCPPSKLSLEREWSKQTKRTKHQYGSIPGYRCPDR